jgi:hypothetical protein
VNTGPTRKLLEQCAASTVWNDLFFSDGKTDELSDGQLGLLIFAAHVGLWTWEVEWVIKDLQAGQVNAGFPMLSWPPEAWRAFHEGRLSAVEKQLIVKQANLTAEERDATPGLEKLDALIDQARGLMRETGKVSA